MGHLVNPIALRMGWSSNWIDLFFVDQKYYPQYLHMLFRLRLLLPFIFHQYWFERKAAFLCSHFEFTKDHNGLLLKVFFYDGKTEDFFHEIGSYIREDRIYHYQNLTHWNWHERKSRSFFLFYVFFVFFRLFHPFYPILQWPRRFLKHGPIEMIARAFFLFDKRGMLFSLNLYPKARKQFISEEEENPRFNAKGKIKDVTFWKYYLRRALRKRRRRSVELCVPMQVRFFYFYLICRNLALLSNRNPSTLGVKPGDFLQLFTFVYCMLSRNNFIFETIRPYLLFLLNYCTKFYKNPTLEFVQVSFLGITNENVTASFIARFIALKLEQGFTTRELLNPLRKEFDRLLRIDRFERKPFRSPFEFLLRRVSHKSYFSSLFRTLLKKLSYFFQKQSYSFFLRWKSKINFDSFLFLDSLRNPPGRTKWPPRRSRKRRGRYLLIFRRLRRYFVYYFYFSLFNYNRILPYYRLFLQSLFRKVSTLQYEIAFGEKLPLFLFPCLIPKLLSNGFENYSSWEITFGNFYKPSLLHLFLLSFRRKMHIFYSQQSHTYLAQAALAKNRWLRLYNPKTSLERRVGFRGFKIQCLGRFTRRQRSAKFTWIRNGVPLNTISAAVDYGHYSIVLVNSLINVRVWFHKDKGFEEYYVKIL